jgi:hypothetical protein
MIDLRNAAARNNNRTAHDASGCRCRRLFAHHKPGYSAVFKNVDCILPHESKTHLLKAKQAGQLSRRRVLWWRWLGYLQLLDLRPEAAADRWSKGRGGQGDEREMKEQQEQKGPHSAI